MLVTGKYEEQTLIFTRTPENPQLSRANLSTMKRKARHAAKMNGNALISHILLFSLNSL